MIRLISYSVGISIGIISLLSFAGTNSARTHPSVVADDNRINTGNMYLSQINRIDPGNSSQEFFDQGKEKLYFLPDEESEPVLQIDQGSDQEPKPNGDGRQETGVNHESPELEQNDSYQEESVDEKF